MSEAMIVSKTPCSLCGRNVKQNTEARARHMIERHPVEAALHMVRAVPKARAAGRAAGTVLLDMIRDFKEILK